MSERERFKLKPNVPAVVTFKFDEPKTGENEYGEYDLWTIRDGEAGTEKSWFVRGVLRGELRDAGVKAGQTWEILRTEKEEGKGFDYALSLSGHQSGNSERQDGDSDGASVPANGEEIIGVLAKRYVTICKELKRQWPELHEKDAELFRSAATSIFIQICRG